MIACYLALGSNLRTPHRQIQQAIKTLRGLPQSRWLKTSRIYFTAPYGVRFQPTYCNAVVLIETRLTPLQLLDACQSIEKKQQRVRKVRWGARTLDIDILLFGDRVINHPRLIIPHPDMANRPFVSEPLFEIAPHLRTTGS